MANTMKDLEDSIHTLAFCRVPSVCEATDIGEAEQFVPGRARIDLGRPLPLGSKAEESTDFRDVPSSSKLLWPTEGGVVENEKIFSLLLVPSAAARSSSLA